MSAVEQGRATITQARSVRGDGKAAAARRRRRGRLPEPDPVTNPGLGRVVATEPPPTEPQPERPKTPTIPGIKDRLPRSRSRPSAVTRPMAFLPKGAVTLPSAESCVRRRCGRTGTDPTEPVHPVSATTTIPAPATLLSTTLQSSAAPDTLKGPAPAAETSPQRVNAQSEGARTQRLATMPSPDKATSAVPHRVTEKQRTLDRSRSPEKSRSVEKRSSEEAALAGEAG